MTRINVAKPWMDVEEIASVAAVIESGWVAQGPRVAEFEQGFAGTVQARHAVAVSSCTAALHLALVVGGVGPGEDVVVPSFSFIATANAPTYVGANPVFADVDAMTGNLTPETITAALTPATTAVILVHQGGVPAEVNALREFCDARGLLLIEDAACAVGSTCHGLPVGAGASIAVWSFHPRKLITTGEGGMLTTEAPEWATRARRLREHAMSVSAADRHRSVLPPAEEYPEVGFNYRMTDLQAAVGLIQIERLGDIIQRRREIVHRYQDAFRDIPGLRCVDDPPWGESNFQSFWVEVLPEFPLGREGLIECLANANISARRGIMAAHRHPAHADRMQAPLPVTDRLTDRTLILPVYHQLHADEQDAVIRAVRTAGRVAA